MVFIIGYAYGIFDYPCGIFLLIKKKAYQEIKMRLCIKKENCGISIICCL